MRRLDYEDPNEYDHYEIEDQNDAGGIIQEDDTAARLKKSIAIVIPLLLLAGLAWGVYNHGSEWRDSILALWDDTFGEEDPHWIEECRESGDERCAEVAPPPPECPSGYEQVWDNRLAYWLCEDIDGSEQTEPDNKGGDAEAAQPPEDPGFVEFKSECFADGGVIYGQDCFFLDEDDELRDISEVLDFTDESDPSKWWYIEFYERILFVDGEAAGFNGLMEIVVENNCYPVTNVEAVEEEGLSLYLSNSSDELIDTEVTPPLREYIREKLDDPNVEQVVLDAAIWIMFYEPVEGEYEDLKNQYVEELNNTSWCVFNTASA